MEWWGEGLTVDVFKKEWEEGDGQSTGSSLEEFYWERKERGWVGAKKSEVKKNFLMVKNN